MALVAACLVGAGPGCRRSDGDGTRFQGVIEYEERDLGFEVSGRLVEIAVRAGDTLAARAT